MEILKPYLKKYLWLIILIMLIAFGAGVFYVAGLYQEHQTDKGIRQSQTQAEAAVSESVNSAKAADNSAIERRTEDAVRDRVITPRLDGARRKSQTSKAELETLQKRLNNEKANLHNSNASAADNCRQLRELFPNERFQYCHD